MALVTIFASGRACAAIDLGLEGVLMLIHMPRGAAMAAFIFSGVLSGAIVKKRAANRTFDGCTVHSSALNQIYKRWPNELDDHDIGMQRGDFKLPDRRHDRTADGVQSVRSSKMIGPRCIRASRGPLIFVLRRMSGRHQFMFRGGARMAFAASSRGYVQIVGGAMTASSCSSPQLAP